MPAGGGSRRSSANPAAGSGSTPSSSRSGRAPKVFGTPSGSKAKQIDEYWGKSKTEENDGETKAARRVRSSSSANLLLKKMKENQLDLDAQMDNGKDEIFDIPDSLADIVDTDNESEQSGVSIPAAVREVDKLLNSEQVRRICAENELGISFECPLFDAVGTLGKVILVKNAKELYGVTGAGLEMSLLDLLFISSPSSRLRTALFERLQKCSANGEGLSVLFDNFCYTICYVFQIDSHSIFASNDQIQNFIVRLDHFIEVFPASLCVSDERHMAALRYENMQFLLDSCWPYLRFEHWEDSQIVSLFHALCRLFLDRGARDFRGRLTRDIQMLLSRLPPERADKLLRHFFTSAFMPSSLNCPFRAFSLFQQLFSRLDQFVTEHRLLAIAILLRSIVESEVDTSTTTPAISPSANLSLAEAVALLPKAVAVLRRASSATNLYIVYTRWMDVITEDADVVKDGKQRMLEGESEQSLAQSLNSVREAFHLLNRRNISNKMVETWSRSVHRISEALHNCRRASKLASSGHSHGQRRTAYGYSLSDSSDSDKEDQRMDK